jgi:hypothetical protein
MTPLASPHQAGGNRETFHMGLQLSPDELRNNRCKYHEEVLRVQNVDIHRLGKEWWAMGSGVLCG